jgi:Ca2+-binding EF-hand superfamily protein
MKIIFFAITGLGIVSMPAIAQTAAQGTTVAEFEARHEARFMQADSNHDGRISAAEWQAAMAGKPGDPARRFARMDRNHDGFVDKGEIDEALARRFHRMDVNGDGLLSPQEHQAAHQRHAPTGE